MNCESKYALKADYINRRSCRLPMVDDIQAEFSGNNAKLKWSVSLDGRKTESETYKILAVFSRMPTIAEAEESASGTAESVKNDQPGPAADVIAWFDEPAPGPTTEIRELIITARAYDGVLDTLRKSRISDTSVKSGVSILDTGYHPASLNLGAGLSRNETVTVFRWDSETLVDTTPVMHLRVTRRVYDNVSSLAGHLLAASFTKQ